MGQEWRLYDVGGTRSSVSRIPSCFLYQKLTNYRQRGAWYPYFDDGELPLRVPFSPIINHTFSRRHNIPCVRSFRVLVNLLLNCFPLHLSPMQTK